MRILVISDSHGSLRNIEKAIEAQPEAKNIIFLGDGAREIEEASYIYTDRIFHIVSGNCDFASMEPSRKIVTVNGTRIFFTHGHYMQNTENLVKTARLEGAKIALYGHTHIAYTGYFDGIHVMNPGSLTRPRDFSSGSYGVIDITDGGIMTFTVRM